MRVAWAGERAILDPAGVVRAADVPVGVHLERRADDLSTLGTLPWLLLLAEHEEATPELPAAADAAMAAGPAALRPRLELDTLGVRFVLPAAPVRLAPRVECRLSVDRSCVPELAAPHPSRSLDAAIRVHRRRHGRRRVRPASRARELSFPCSWPSSAARPRGLPASPLAALSRVLRARADRRAGLARWVAAVFAGYRVVLAQARCWEWRHAQPALVREVG